MPAPPTRRVCGPFIKKTEKTPAGEIVLALQRAKELKLSRRSSDLHRRWSKGAEYKEAYDALGEEFDVAGALIEARTAAGLSQSQLARRMTPRTRFRRASRGPRPVTFSLKPHSERSPCRTASISVAVTP